ncbi:ABC transporter substrate-binding protein [Chenggangzhangella methanolivorans]|uniref:ABC transporter substrate-binding protein n=1 Tax=Chenggangzhangella methanolivorans TaxID=1437009 RepID=UPI003615D95F
MLFALAFGAIAVAASNARAQTVVTDVAGRQVEIAGPAKRIIVEAPGYYPALALLSRDAADLVVGVGATESRGQFEAEQDLAGKPRLGTMSFGTFAVETALALKPDLLIATLAGPGQQDAVERAFAAAGVPVLYVDFFVDPARNTIPSIELVGAAIGAEKQAAAFADFHRRRIATIVERLAAEKPARPKLMIYRRSADGTCCWSFAKGFMSPFFDMLRVRNIAEDKLPGMVGQLSLEAVIESDPDIFVATDWSFWAESLFGPERTREQTLARLEATTRQPGLDGLAAVRERRVHAIDTTLMRSPLNVLAVELFAKWRHPTLFADIDPQKSLDEINGRFLARPLKGSFWASLDAPSETSSGTAP